MGKPSSKTVSTIFFIIVGGILIGGAIYNNQKYKPLNKVEEAIIKSHKESEQKEKEEEAKVTAAKEKEKFKSPYKEPPPEIQAKAYGVVNLTDDVVMYTKNPDEELPPASITKIMTAIVALEEYDLNKPVVMPENCTKLDAAKVGIKPNEVLTMEDMLFGLLVKSGADAACAIANVGDENEFVNKMNQKAKELELQHTNFKNEIGLDSLDTEKVNEQRSSVNDILKISRYALKFSAFRKIVGTKTITIKTSTGNSYTIDNTNDLLFSIPGTVGIKTGFTDEARGCLSYLYENKGQEVLIVILGSEDRFTDTKTLLDWANQQIKLIKADNASFGG